jgi:Zn-dependent protease
LYWAYPWRVPCRFQNRSGFVAVDQGSRDSTQGNAEVRGRSDSFAVGLGYGLLLYASNVLHTAGHTIFGRLAKAPMAVNVLTSTRDVNVYVQPGASAPPGRRMLRALGGPLANVLGGLAALAASWTFAARWLSMSGYFNLAIGFWTLAPIPSLDGWVIWRTVFRRDRAHAA